MKLKIETAEDLILDIAPTHALCGPSKTIEADDHAINVRCACGIILSFAYGYLAGKALEELEREKMRAAKRVNGRRKAARLKQMVKNVRPIKKLRSKKNTSRNKKTKRGRR